MKSKRFNLSKVLLTFMFMLLTAVVLVACGDKDQDLVDEALTTIEATYASGDTQNSVTKNLILPESIGEITVSWVSSNAAVISNKGVVTRPATDTEVTLTATLKLGNVEETYSVKVKVKAAVVVTTPQEALDAIVITGTTVEKVGSVYETTTNIVLPVTSLELAVVWTTSNADYVGADGMVTRPNFGIADQVVTLTATIDGEEAIFLIKVLAYTEKPISQILDEAKVALLLDGISGGVATDLVLPTTVGAEGVVVTWSSNNTDYIANDGTLTRPAMGLDDVTVMLTATLTKGTQSVTKEFSVLVLANVEPTLYASIADVLENAAKGDFVKVEDVTVVGLTSDSYFMADSTGILAVYYGSDPVVVVGTVYDIYGLFDVYNGSPQLNNTSDSTMPSVATESDGEVTVLTPTIVEDVDLFVQDTAPTFDASNLFVYEYLQITAKVQIQGDGNYDTFYVNPDFVGTINSDANSAYTDNALMIYYKSNKAAFTAFDGKIITFNAFLYSYRNDRTIFTIVFTEEAEDITVNATDAEIVQMAKDEFGSMFEYEYVADEILDLQTMTSQGATVVWSTESELVDPLTGELTMPATGQEDVTLTASITKGIEVGTFTVTFKAGELPNSTILEAIQLGKGHLVEITGIITSSEYQNTYFIQDETGGIAIYTYVDEAETFLQENLGKEITISGEKDVYNGLNQIKDIIAYVLVGDPAAAIVAVNVDEHNLDSTLLEPFQGQLVELTGLVIIGKNSDSYGNTYVTLLNSVSGEEITMKQDARVTLSTDAQILLDSLAIGDAVTITNPLSWNRGPYLYFTDSTIVVQGELTDEAAVAATKFTLEVDVDQPIIVEETLTLLDTYLGTTITWTSDNIDVITDAGVVTIPEDMKQVTVTLTATITKGAATETQTFEILVGDIVPISAAIDASVDDVIRVQGVVTAAEYYRTYFIQDATGGIAIYTYDEAEHTLFQDNIGKEVIVTGTRDEYNGMRQISPTNIEVLTTGELPLATNVDATPLTETDMLVHQGLLVELNNLLVTKIYVDSYGNITITLSRPSEGNKVSMKFDARGSLTTEAQDALDAIVVGDVLNVTATMAWSKGPFLYYTSTTILSEGTLSDADKVAADADTLDVVEEILEEETLVLPTEGALGSTIVWTSSNDALINASTGVVVMPLEGTETVTLTATVTLNAEEVILTFDVVVGVLTPSLVSGASDLFFSEYIEGSSSNKALEIFNGTGADVDLSLYTVNQYSNGGTEVSNTITLTGILLNGDVYVIYNASADQAIIDEGDIVSNVTYFNGNDAIELVKSGVVIDVIGEVGVDEIWTVGTGSTSDYTLVRVETVTDPNTVFTASEWVVNPVDTFTFIGSHTMVTPVVIDLFFSEYIEGSSNNKAIEIYNPTGADVDLSVYTVELYSNGATDVSQTYSLTGILAAGEVYIIAHDSADAAILAVADVALAYPSVASWNGDDAVVLRKDGAILDIILSIGHTKDDKVAAEVTWVRNAVVMGPNTVFDMAEWTEYPQDTFTYLGSHTVS